MEWISVKDRLPSERNNYLVYRRNSYGNYISIADWTPNYDGFEERLKGKAMWYKYDSEYGDYEIDNVSHWMALPEPPEIIKVTYSPLCDKTIELRKTVSFAR